MTKLVNNLSATSTELGLDGDLGVIGEVGDILTIEQEKVTVVHRLGNYVYKIERGASSTQAATHASGTTVTSTGTEQDAVAVVTGVTAGVSKASSAAILGTNKNLDVLALPVGGLAIGPGAGTATTVTAAEVNTLHSSAITNQDLVNLHAMGTSYEGYGLTGCLVESIPRQLCSETNLAALSTGQIFNQLIYIPGGTVVTNISFFSGTQAASAPTHYSFGLYNYSATAPTAIGISADQTSTAWAANTIKTLALASGPFTVTTSGLYYVAIGMTATTAVSLKGLPARTDGSLCGTAPILAGINATGNPAGAMPATIGVTTAGLNSVWFQLS